MAQNVDIVPGPVDDRVLYDQKNHISAGIWDHQKEHVKQIHNHNQCPNITHPGVLDYVRRAGFFGLYHLLFVTIDHALMTALVERWRPETHTFHFPVGELTITLQDIEVLAGVKVDGRALVRSEKGESIEARKAWVEELLGLEPDADDYNKPGMLSCRWLAQHFDPETLPADAADETVRQFARASILRMLGSQYLQDKQGSHVALYFLPFLADLDACGTYSWGSAILAFLYRSLCKAASRGIDGLNGALVLLQFWAWSRLRQVRNCDVLRPEEAPYQGWPRYPYGRRWLSTSGTFARGGVNRNLRSYRDEFDAMTVDQVIWEPYTDVLRDLPDECKAGQAIWRARVPMICVDIVEWHFPDRVMRQFGMRQRVPRAAERDDHLHTKSRKGNPGCDWVAKYATSIQRWNARRQHVETTEIHNGHQTVVDDYAEWYQRITRRWIGRTITHPPSRGSQPKSALHEVMLKGLRKSYELACSIGHEDGIQHLKLVFATIGVQPPVIVQADAGNGDGSGGGNNEDDHDGDDMEDDNENDNDGDQDDNEDDNDGDDDVDDETRGASSIPFHPSRFPDQPGTSSTPYYPSGFPDHPGPISTRYYPSGFPDQPGPSSTPFYHSGVPSGFYMPDQSPFGSQPGSDFISSLFDTPYGYRPSYTSPQPQPGTPGSWPSGGLHVADHVRRQRDESGQPPRRRRPEQSRDAEQSSTPEGGSSSQGRRRLRPVSGFYYRP